MSAKFSTFLMFTGEAADALELYTSIFEHARVSDKSVHGDANPEMAGKIMQATLMLGDHKVMVSDSPPIHDFSFTPSTSIFVTLDDEAEFETVFAALSHDGSVMMPPDNYGFSKRFAWTTDKFGVSWQLNLD